MFRIIKTPNIDFMAKRKLALALSGIAVVAAIVMLLLHGLNRGIEFTGGTTLQIKFAQAPHVAAIRGALTDVGLSGQQVTTIGEAAAHEIVLRLPATGDTKTDESQGAEALDAVRSLLGVENHPDTDLNVIGVEPLAALLGTRDLAEAILERRTEVAIFSSFDELNAVPGMTAAALDTLTAKTEIGPLSLRKRSYVGPAVGKQLVQKTLYAIIGSLIGMLLYIWVRFQLQWGFAAVVALAHDTLITLGLFSIFNQEMSLSVVAAFLTLVGYSVNDTVVVFDRIRENLRTRGSESIETTINQALNQTLSRTIITSGLTWIVVLALFVFGGAALKPFAFVLTVGVIVGTYSSIFIAAPFLVIWTEFLAKRRSASATKIPARSAS